MEFNEIIFFAWTALAIAFVVAGLFHKSRAAGTWIAFGGLCFFGVAAFFVQPSLYRAGVSKEAADLQDQLHTARQEAASYQRSLSLTLTQNQELKSSVDKLDREKAKTAEEAERKKKEFTGALEERARIVSTLNERLRSAEAKGAQLDKTVSELTDQLRGKDKQIENASRAHPGEKQSSVCTPILSAGPTDDGTLRNPLGPLEDKFRTEFYEIKRSQSQPSIVGASGVFYDIILKNDAGKQMIFDEGQFELRNTRTRIRESVLSVVANIFLNLKEPSNCVIYMIGRADKGSIENALTSVTPLTSEIEYLPLHGDEFENKTSIKKMQNKYTNYDLPLLRSFSMAKVWRETLSRIPIRILEGTVADRIDPNERRVDVLLFVPVS